MDGIFVRVAREECLCRRTSRREFRPLLSGNQLGSFPIVIAEHAAQTLTALDLPGGAVNFGAGFNEVIIEPLVIPLLRIMREVFVESGPEGFFTQEDSAIEALFFKHAEKSFDVGIQIRTSGRQAEALGPSQLELATVNPARQTHEENVPRAEVKGHKGTERVESDSRKQDKKSARCC